MESSCNHGMQCVGEGVRSDGGINCLFNYIYYRKSKGQRLRHISLTVQFFLGSRVLCSAKNSNSVCDITVGLTLFGHRIFTLLLSLFYCSGWDMCRDNDSTTVMVHQTQINSGGIFFSL